MDKSLVFNTLEECRSALDEINTIMRTKAEEQGHVVLGDMIVGERNGQPDYDAMGTTTWDEPRELNGKFYLAVPEDDIMKNVTFVVVFGEYNPTASED